jgi:hypothetical protein
MKRMHAITLQSSQSVRLNASVWIAYVNGQRRILSLTGRLMIWADVTPNKGCSEMSLIDEAIEAVFASDILPCERGIWRMSKTPVAGNLHQKVNVNNDIAVIPCGNSTIDVRELVTLVLQHAGVDVTPNKG